ncbi:MAG: helix-turn-helix domain-containing protein, partial [Desulforhabdus sp.]|jgi:DNA-binding NtrC family response regulator|nr:helix-turn-helix domain-containing protein [Desulforhabdus sp.]
LAEYFLARFADEMDIDSPGMTDAAKNILTSYHWPGNVRELANTVQKALIFSRGCPICQEDISQAIYGRTGEAKSPEEGSDEEVRQWIRKALASGANQNLFDSLMDRLASTIINEALILTGGNRSRTAKLLGISRPTLLSKIEKYRLKIETSVTSD